MKIDIKSELRDFLYITNVYKYISNYNLKGHKIGRKIGDMLEILTMGIIYQEPELVKRLSTEEKLEGYTTAGHKVEFGFFNTQGENQNLFGAIECKCVGVEETTSGKGDKYFRKLLAGNSFTIDFSGHWQSSPILFEFKLLEIIDAKKVKVEITANSDTYLNRVFEFSLNENIKIVIDENSQCLATTPKGNMAMEIPTIIRTCKIIRFHALTATTATFALYDCLTGPQTIEKAKQASLVAMDLRKKVDGYWGKEEIPAGKKYMTFVHVICEYSHWEKKSRNVINTCIDHNVIVPDIVIIKAFEVFEKNFGIYNMLNKISKKEFIMDTKVKESVDEVLQFFESQILYDIALEKFIRFKYSNNSLVVFPLVK